MESDKLTGRCKALFGIDYDFDSLKKHKCIRHRMRGDIIHLSVKSNVFDLVTANMVVEHLHDPETQFGEIWRALRPGGLFIFHTPNIYGYTTLAARVIPDALKRKLAYLLEGRMETDVFPTFYRANSEKRIRTLATQTGFKVRMIKTVVTSAEFAVVPPIVVLELYIIRLLMTKTLRFARPNLIAVLEKIAQ